ncbi:phosphotransferase enzyme family protein [Aspergillus eucalypticola CBS 122712]|uniref:Altered inheritance of mitochondria protein 9, mitochondrial n=1 Tax=Aspergillus eucalypticola (strain CBS 122712 / IBT 29274) TaxID=1448314 RepID=A0A317VP90_ASPEC|nr:phosphotransferase enzyme family protein [Aspergillus eucalypticola CBS 122712]PWY75735.1 phosphotransferase enzyme family protein [Aspergillus eucalypticola CBS 122712]
MSTTRYPPWSLVRSASTKPTDTNSHYFNYTSGRWLHDESLQLEKRHITFNVSALQQITGQTLGTQCVAINKLREGMFNKVFSLKMANGKEVLARIPNPNAGHPHYVVASEVATLDFLRAGLKIPVPRVLSWSSSSQTNPVAAEYIIMEKVQGQQLSEVWDTMSEAQRFRLVRNLVHIERRLMEAKFTQHGSLYYRDTFPRGRSIAALPGLSKYVFGPTTQRSFWEDEVENLDIDRGPWETAMGYLSAVANREIVRIRHGHSNTNYATIPLARTPKRRKEHIQLLEKFLAVLPHILPSDSTQCPVMLHHDLHVDNIFVDGHDPSQITSIIDWQAVHIAPLFLTAKFPSIFNCDDDYTWGALQPKLPTDFDVLSTVEKEEAEQKLERLRLKKFYELASRKFNPSLVLAMDQMRDDNDPTSFIFHIVSQTSKDGPIPLRELLIQVYEKWAGIMAQRGSTSLCPIYFSRKDIDQSRQQTEAWAAAFSKFDDLRAQVSGEEGWVSHDDYKEANKRWKENEKTLQALREQLEALV